MAAVLDSPAARPVSASLIRAVGALVVGFILCFMALKITSDGPFSRDPMVSDEVRPNLQAAFDADAPIWSQAGRYLWGVLRGDFGPSMTLPQYSVGELIDETLTPTMISLAPALVFTVLLAWCFAMLDRRAGRRSRAVLETGLAIAMALPIALISWGAIYGTAAAFPNVPELRIILVYLVLPPLIVGPVVAATYHVIRTRAEAIMADPASATVLAFRICLPLFLLGVASLDTVFQRGSVGFLLFLSVRNGDLTAAAGLALVITAITVALDVAFMFTMTRVAWSDPYDAPEMPDSRRRRGSRVMAGATLVGLVVALVLTAAFIGNSAIDSDFEAIELQPRLSDGHLLGTDDLGRDFLAQIALVTETSLGQAAVFGAIATVGAAMWGLAMIRRRNTLRAAMVALADVLATVPWAFIALSFAANHSLLPPWIALAIGANLMPAVAGCIARTAGRSNTPSTGAAARNPMWDGIALLTLSVAYAIIVGTAFEFGILDYDPSRFSVGSFFFFHMQDFTKHPLPLMIVAAMPIIAVLGLTQISYIAQRRTSAENRDVFAF